MCLSPSKQTYTSSAVLALWQPPLHCFSGECPRLPLSGRAPPACDGHVGHAVGRSASGLGGALGHVLHHPCLPQQGSLCWSPRSPQERWEHWLLPSETPALSFLFVKDTASQGNASFKVTNQVQSHVRFLEPVFTTGPVNIPFSFNEITFFSPPQASPERLQAAPRPPCALLSMPGAPAPTAQGPQILFHNGKLSPQM